MAPFLSPKQLPEIYLGLPGFTQWEISPKNSFLQLALEILAYLDTAPWTEGFRIQRIDVSNAFAASLGQREIVLFTEEELVLPQGVVCVFSQDFASGSEGLCAAAGQFFWLAPHHDGRLSAAIGRT